MSKLIVVANKVMTPQEDAHAGGLARGVHHALNRFGGTWFGWSGTVVETASNEPQITTHENINYATIDLTPAEYEGYYLGFANSTLWPLFHQPSGEVGFNQEHYAQYCQVNARFAQILAAVIKPGDLVWVHDYHLIPLAGELRRRGVTNRIGIFLHTPFVPPSIMQVLPPCRRLIDDFCEYDLVGFQTEQDLSAFNEHLASRTTDAANSRSRSERNTLAAVFPIGVDPDEIATLADAAAKSSASATEWPTQQKTIIGVDRLDHSKGLPNRMDAYELLLRRYPEHRQQVTFLQIAPPSRTDIDRYRALSESLDQKVGHINGSYAELDWNPIHYVNKTYTQDTLAGLYRSSRVGLVTPLKDGMNLVAKEYIAAQNASDPGVLVLSRFAGAAQELTSALLVNPWDVDQMCDALHRALRMPLAERRARWIDAMAAVRNNTATTWCARFIKALSNALPDKAADKSRRTETRLRPRPDQVHTLTKGPSVVH